MVSFDNTQVAFESKSDYELKRAHLLFSTIGKPLFVNLGQHATQLAFKLRLPIEGLIKSTIYKQFVGGESMEDCEKAIGNLANYGIGTILDYAVEGVANEAHFEQNMHEFLKVLDRAKGDERIPFFVFKITGLGRFEILEKQSAGAALSASEQEEWMRIKSRVEALCAKAHATQKPILVDAEESWIQPVIDELVLDLMRRYNQEKAIVYNTAQTYLKSRLSYTQDLVARAAEEGFFVGVKIVRGAYMEKERARAEALGYPDPVQLTKADTDAAFNACVHFCLSHYGRVAVCVGTHNEASSMQVTQWMKELGIPKKHPHVYFAQLYGMSDHISFNLSKSGYNVAKYVPYGPVRDVIPYLIRRAQENTSVAGQTGRELSLIRKELARRKHM